MKRSNGLMRLGAVPVRQRGLSLIFALIALAAVSLAAVGLVRAVGGGAMVVGNLGLKMDTTAAADRGTEIAMNWLMTHLGGTGLDQNDTSDGYYATSLTALDPTGRNPGPAARAVVDWNGDSCSGLGTFSACISPSATTTLSGGVKVSHVITRMCAIVGSKDAAANSCAVHLTNAGTEDTNTSSLAYGREHGMGLGGTRPYYRIVVRAVGGRSTVSFTETFVHF